MAAYSNRYSRERTRDNIAAVELAAHLMAIVGPKGVQRGVSLAPLTTFKVGGPAEWLVTAVSAEDVRAVARAAFEAHVPLTVLGGGSNVLVADAGVRGVVLRVRGGDVREIDGSHVRADAGVTINGLVRWTINRGVQGVEAWAGTPGTVGGAVRGNAHFRGRLIGDLISRVQLVSHAGEVIEVPSSEMEFGYDSSRVQGTGEVVVSADFRVGRGDPAALRAVARESLAFRKRTQPLESASAGCIFQNPDPQHERVPDAIPASAGALVDRAGLKGAREGGAMVSPAHANFIVNDGRATAADIRRLIERCREAVRERFGIELREEVVYLGEW
jgi:UDP-N-acetylmuramate dehydrogenase